MYGICNRLRALSARLLTLAFVWVAPGVAWSQPAGGEDRPKPAASETFLRATPNPIVSPTGKGSTTIDWRCESPGAQVYLSVDGGAEQIFSSGMIGHQEVPWISAGPAYEFRLYEGAERKERLASITVTCSRTPVSPEATAGTTAADADRSSADVAAGEADGPFIRATPNPIPAGSGTAITTIRWRSSSPAAHVYLSVDSGPEKIFSSGMNGRQAVDWINAGPSYGFHLYADADRTQRLASVIVTRAREAAPAAASSPAPPVREAPAEQATKPRQATEPPQAAAARGGSGTRDGKPAHDDPFPVSMVTALAAVGTASVVIPFLVMRLLMLLRRRRAVARREKPSDGA